jgi:hypothetical protein
MPFDDLMSNINYYLESFRIRGTSGMDKVAEFCHESDKLISKYPGKIINSISAPMRRTQDNCNH